MPVFYPSKTPKNKIKQFCILVLWPMGEIAPELPHIG
jgi:hypothetical protein